MPLSSLQLYTNVKLKYRMLLNIIKNKVDNREKNYAKNEETASQLSSFASANGTRCGFCAFEQKKRNATFSVICARKWSSNVFARNLLGDSHDARVNMIIIIINIIIIIISINSVCVIKMVNDYPLG